MFMVFLQAAASMLRQSGFFTYSCCTALIFKIASPTASISWSLSLPMIQTTDRKFLLFAWLFLLRSVVPRPTSARPHDRQQKG